MSDTDSFIEEVSEEVRRDNLFRMFRKYGWIGIAVVVVLVGGAAYNEWSKSQSRAAAEQAGDSILEVLEGSDASARAAAFAALPAEGNQAAIVALLGASEALSAGDKDAAVQMLQSLANEAEVATTYSQLAELKLLLILDRDLTSDERLTRLVPLALPGAPYRLLAEEHMALAHVDGGNYSAALKLLQGIMLDTEVTAGQRRRVSQLIIALGGDTEAT